MKDADYWIKRLNLSPYQGGGYFRETYRAEETIPRGALPNRFSGPRALSTLIYYLLRTGQQTNFHRLRADEMWHFYTGSALTLHLITGGQYSKVWLGPDFDRGEVFHTVLRAGWWFGATVDDPGAYALVGCTVVPGFHPDDYELGDRLTLLQLYPEYGAIIRKLTG